MTIKELKSILEQAPDENREVYIPEPLDPIDTPKKAIRWGSTTRISVSFDDNNDLEIYQIA